MYTGITLIIFNDIPVITVCAPLENITVYIRGSLFKLALSAVDKEVLPLHVLASEVHAVEGRVAKGKFVLLQVLSQQEEAAHTVHESGGHTLPSKQRQ